MAEQTLTDEETNRLFSRLEDFKLNPQKLSPEVYFKCRALHEEIVKDSFLIESVIRDGNDLSKIDSVNPRRAALVEWLAKTP